MGAIRQVLRVQRLRRLIFAWSASTTGLWIAPVGLDIYCFRKGGASAVGFEGAARTLPAGLLAPSSA